ncbi:hypothetical protein EV193_11095 [Herbihabitans rhizosphaerae]|uniref:Uncharacterized protein n=1 Tax=Herbihabitans rhizosphaerae TaxID=1872711 RepID=A0A4Q7KIB9_9PSEU|nr:hypothetical protein [Herbihabitans rhizosphaerae]RZS33945.1 hypothetical protein EV193_11095 [Herbihabitans rhizosphaerae]
MSAQLLTLPVPSHTTPDLHVPPERLHRDLATTLVAEDLAEQEWRLDSHERLTCSEHGQWLHRCVHAKPHVNKITGYRWCRPCRAELEVAVDEIDGTVTVHCPKCDRGAETKADFQLISACRQSLDAAHTARAAVAA